MPKIPLWRSESAKGREVEKIAFERDPESGGVHFVFGQFEFAGADVFVSEEFDFLEAHHLRTHQHVAVGASRGPGDAALSAISSTRTCV